MKREIMFKFLLILSTITLFLLLRLDENFFNPEAKIMEEKSTIQTTKEEPIIQKKHDSHSILAIDEEIKESVSKIKVDEYAEIKEIIEKAHTSYGENQFKIALQYYNDAINKSINSQKIEVLKLFTMAHFKKASIYKLSQKENHKRIIESYNSIIQKLKNQKDIELQKLYAKALFYKADISERDISLSIYDVIINKFSNSSDGKLLKLYTDAQFKKAYLSSTDDALDIFTQIIDKLKNRDDKKMLKELFKAQQNKVYILEQNTNQKEELLELYDEIIKKFSQYKEEEYQSILDDTLFQKSFLLMGQNDEGSMEIYDAIINKYETSNINNFNDSPIPLKVEYSIVNNIELSLITNNDDSNYRELADKYLNNKKDTKPQLDMLEILKNAQVSNQDEALKKWKEENKDYLFTNWSFEELKTWNSQMEAGEQKERISEYLNEFSKHSNIYHHHQQDYEYIGK